MGRRKKKAQLTYAADDARGSPPVEEVKIHAEGSSYHFFPDPMGSVQVIDGTGYDQKQAWDVAVRFQDIKRYAHVSDVQKRKLQARAVSGVLEKARKLIGTVASPERPALLRQEEFEASGARGELDLDASWSEGEPIFDSRIEKDTPVAIIMDVSMSMKGDKLAHLALAASAIAFSIPSERLCFLGFDSRIRWVKRFDESLAVDALVERVLNLPAGGFTHMELALTALQEELERVRKPRASVILIGDGKYTEGRDPLTLPLDFHRLHVLKIGRDIGGRDVLKQLAERGKGVFVEARSYADLPRSLYQAIRMLVR